VSTPHPAADHNASQPRCPFCGSTDVELLALFGSQPLTQQHYCRTCRTPFEHVKDADAERRSGPASAAEDAARPAH
jgi:hypothetical protein